MPNKEFLETYPLYRKFQISLDPHHMTKKYEIPKPALNMDCARCNSAQTFNMDNEYSETGSLYEPWGKTFRLRYVCSSCKTLARLFFVSFFNIRGKDEEGNLTNAQFIVKVGQTPAWDIDIDNELSKKLGDHTEYYKKGLTCESQGYGIGAYAYFRRVAEDVIDELLESINDLIESTKKADYEKGLKEVRSSKNATEKIDLVKELLPTSLRPNGINPLGTIHAALSAGLHNEDDEECLELADAIKKSLIFLVNQVIRAKAESQQFAEGMKTIQAKLDKKTKDSAETEKQNK